MVRASPPWGRGRVEGRCDQRLGAMTVRSQSRRGSRCLVVAGGKAALGCASKHQQLLNRDPCKDTREGLPLTLAGVCNRGLQEGLCGRVDGMWRVRSVLHGTGRLITRTSPHISVRFTQESSLQCKRAMRWGAGGAKQAGAKRRLNAPGWETNKRPARCPLVWHQGIIQSGEDGGQPRVRKSFHVHVACRMWPSCNFIGCWSGIGQNPLG